MAWLEAGQNIQKEEHTLQKEIVSDAAGFEARQSGRDLLRSMASPGKHQRVVLDLEAMIRDGDSSEPADIYCRSILAALGQAAANNGED